MITCALYLVGCGQGIVESNEPVANEAEDNITSEEKREGDVRSAKFGDSMEIVEQYEEGEPYEHTGDTLLYETELNGFTTTIGYSFNENDQLYSVLYLINEEHTNYNLYCSDYESINDILTEKYGKPASEDVNKSSLYEYCSDAGEALSLGQVVFVTKWELENMNITHVLINDNSILHMISYDSKKYDETKSTSGF